MPVPSFSRERCGKVSRNLKRFTGLAVTAVRQTWLRDPVTVRYSSDKGFGAAGLSRAAREYFPVAPGKPGWCGGVKAANARARQVNIGETVFVLGSAVIRSLYARGSSEHYHRLNNTTLLRSR